MSLRSPSKQPGPASNATSRVTPSNTNSSLSMGGVWRSTAAKIMWLDRSLHVNQPAGSSSPTRFSSTFIAVRTFTSSQTGDTPRHSWLCSHELVAEGVQYSCTVACARAKKTTRLEKTDVACRNVRHIMWMMYDSNFNP